MGQTCFCIRVRFDDHHAELLELTCQRSDETNSLFHFKLPKTRSVTYWTQKPPLLLVWSPWVYVHVEVCVYRQEFCSATPLFSS